LSAQLFLVPDLPPGDLYTLDGPEGHHAATVMRLGPGEPVQLGDGHGSTVDAVVVAAGKGSLTLSLGQRRDQPPPEPRFVVVQAIPKGERGELAVQAMTEVGADVIVPWSAARCVAVWKGERGERSRRRWIDTAREAAKQARRPWLPEIGELATTRTVESLVHAAAAGLVLHEEASTSVSTVDLPAAGDVVVVIGPEGGITDDEVAALTRAGGSPVRLGTSVLRTSTAGVAALAALSVRLRRW
jgi:16S rRNA (uracil1498-N3)-methyltransferase